jgi:hypothetical protein
MRHSSAKAGATAIVAALLKIVRRVTRLCRRAASHDMFSSEALLDRISRMMPAVRPLSFAFVLDFHPILLGYLSKLIPIQANAG